MTKRLNFVPMSEVKTIWKAGSDDWHWEIRLSPEGTFCLHDCSRNESLYYFKTFEAAKRVAELAQFG